MSSYAFCQFMINPINTSYVKLLVDKGIYYQRLLRDKCIIIYDVSGN